MGAFQNYPYADVHQLNLDWIIKEVKKIKDREDEIDQAVNDSKGYAETAQESAENASQSALDADESLDTLRNELQDWEDEAGSLRDQVNDNTQGISVNSARIDAVISGTTPDANAELIDIRVGANGVTYASAGDAVRGQFDEVADDLSELANYNYIEPELLWEVGQVKNDGTIGTSSSYKHTQAIPVKEGDLVEWKVSGGTSWMVSLYETSAGTAIEGMTGEDGTVNNGLLTIPAGTNYIRLSSVATSISQAYVRIYASTEERLEQSDDFFNGTGIRKGYIWKYGYIKNDGTIVSNGGYRYTLPIPVNSGEKYLITTQSSSSTLAVALYDNDGIVLTASSVGTDALSDFNITIPDNIIALAVTCARAQINNMSILRKGTTLSEIIPEEVVDSDTVKQIVRSYASLPLAEHRCATINFQFDDGDVKDADIVNIFKGKNAVCGFSLISNISIGRVEEYLGYQKDGFEILSHSTDSDGMSDSSISSAVIEGKLKNSKKILTNYGFLIRGFVTPRSAMASNFIQLLSKYYDFAYTTYFGDYTGTGTPWFTKTAEMNKLSRVSVQGTTLANMKLAVDNAIANNGLLTFYGHSADLDTGDNETTANLNELLDYINTKQDDLQCVLLAPSEAMDFYFHIRHEDYLEMLNI